MVAHPKNRLAELNIRLLGEEIRTAFQAEPDSRAALPLPVLQLTGHFGLNVGQVLQDSGEEPFCLGLVLADSQEALEYVLPTPQEAIEVQCPTAETERG